MCSIRLSSQQCLMFAVTDAQLNLVYKLVYTIVKILIDLTWNK